VGVHRGVLGIVNHLGMRLKIKVDDVRVAKWDNVHDGTGPKERFSPAKTPGKWRGRPTVPVLRR